MSLKTDKKLAIDGGELSELYGRWKDCIEMVSCRERSLNSGKEGSSGVWEGKAGQTNVIECADKGRIARKAGMTVHWSHRSGA